MPGLGALARQLQLRRRLGLPPRRLRRGRGFGLFPAPASSVERGAWSPSRASLAAAGVFTVAASGGPPRRSVFHGLQVLMKRGIFCPVPLRTRNHLTAVCKWLLSNRAPTTFMASARYFCVFPSVCGTRNLWSWLSAYCSLCYVSDQLSDSKSDSYFSFRIRQTLVWVLLCVLCVSFIL